MGREKPHKDSAMRNAKAKPEHDLWERGGAQSRPQPCILFLAWLRGARSSSMQPPCRPEKSSPSLATEPEPSQAPLDAATWRLNSSDSALSALTRAVVKLDLPWTVDDDVVVVELAQLVIEPVEVVQQNVVSVNENGGQAERNGKASFASRCPGDSWILTSRTQKKWSSSGAASPTDESGSRSFDVRCASARLHPATTFCTPTLWRTSLFPVAAATILPTAFSPSTTTEPASRRAFCPSCWTTLPSSPRVSLLPTSTASHSHSSATDTVLFSLLCPFHPCRWVGSLVQDLQSSTEQCRCIGKIPSMLSLSRLSSSSAPPDHKFDKDGYTLRWTFANELDLTFVVVYQRILQLSYIEELLDTVRSLFTDLFASFVRKLALSLQECCRPLAHPRPPLFRRAHASSSALPSKSGTTSSPRRSGAWKKAAAQSKRKGVLGEKKGITNPSTSGRRLGQGQRPRHSKVDQGGQGLGRPSQRASKL
ncbi:hypothetical protein L1887_58441 [Cichorium endivia]|nr:hypothetical protein L1887_58441 [Cichorium endivia]